MFCIEVCQVVNDSLELNEIRDLFDFVSGGNQDELSKQNVEEFLSNEYAPRSLPHQFQEDLIQYLSSHNEEQARKVNIFLFFVFNDHTSGYLNCFFVVSMTGVSEKCHPKYQCAIFVFF